MSVVDDKEISPACAYGVPVLSPRAFGKAAFQCNLPSKEELNLS